MKKAISLLKNGNFPHKFFQYVEGVEFLVDPTIVNSSILGQTSFFSPNRVVLSPLVSKTLMWSNHFGVPNNEMAIETIVHELTHLQQIRDWKWFGWPIIHLPILNLYTVEKWAKENGIAARDYLESQYRRQTSRLVIDRR